jgi:four helix bundle protein
VPELLQTPTSAVRGLSAAVGSHDSDQNRGGPFIAKKRPMSYKFENLEVWSLALEYTDHVYQIAGQLPDHERFNLAEQIKRAANSIALNIAEGSTGLSDAEQARFLQIAIRSLVETVSILHLIHRREYLEDVTRLRETYKFSEKLFAQLKAFRSTLEGEDPSAVQEELVSYDEDTPF